MAGVNQELPKPPPVNSEEVSSSSTAPPAASPSGDRPLQFTLAWLLGVTAALAVLFGVCRYLAIGPRASLIVATLVVVSFLAAGLLVRSIARFER